MAQTYYDYINFNKDNYEINWKFYVDNNNQYSKQYVYTHVIDVLKADCHSVFRVDEGLGSIDWVGYSSDNDEEDVRRNMLIDNPSFLFKKATNTDKCVYITLGKSVFRYITIRLRHNDPSFYEIIDYEEKPVPIDKCKICDEITVTVDGICDRCEPIWLKFIENSSCCLPPETMLDTLFTHATELARFHVQQKRK